MIDFANFYQIIAKNKLHHWLYTLPAQMHEWEREHKHGFLPRWEKVLKKLPNVTTAHVNISDKFEVGAPGEMSDSDIRKTESLLQKFHPWRKGPFHVHGIHIDTEWRSDWKWERLREHVSPLKYRFVLDVGCGSGYHMWRMLGDGAEFVVGIDPSQLFLMQFEAMRHFANDDQRVHLLPLGIQELPKLRAFDTVFSMGVLYHRKSPIEHIEQLKNQLRDGGELVLETLVIDGNEQAVLVPGDRYAQMRNVWFLPSCAALKLWVEKLGFENVRIVDVSDTSIDEQRATEWMRNESLVDFLDPNDHSKTVEGYPAPKRAVLIATKAYAEQLDD